MEMTVCKETDTEAPETPVNVLEWHCPCGTKCRTAYGLIGHTQRCDAMRPDPGL